MYAIRWITLDGVFFAQGPAQNFSRQLLHLSISRDNLFHNLESVLLSTFWHMPFYKEQKLKNYASFFKTLPSQLRPIVTCAYNCPTRASSMAPWEDEIVHQFESGLADQILSSVLSPDSIHISWCGIYWGMPLGYK